MRTVCLATPVEDRERFERADEHFASVGLKVDYSVGLHKSTSGLDTTHLYMVDRGPGSPDEGIPYGIGKHPVNIWLGHWSIWNALVLSGDPRWFVVECDAKFPPDWNVRFDEAIRDADTHLVGWDLLYIGSCATKFHPRQHVIGSLYRFFSTAPQCNHAYVLTREAAQMMLRTMRKVWAPVDIQQASECWGNALPRCEPMVAPRERALNVYAVLPRLVGQWNTELSE